MILSSRWFLAFFMICLFCPLPGESKIIEKVYAVVNGEIITLTEIVEYQDKLKNGGFLNDLLFSDPEERDKALHDKDFLIKLMVDEKIMDYEIKQQGLQITEERVKKEIGSIAKRQNMSVNQMEQAIGAQGMDFLEYRDFVKKSIERRQLVEKEITSKIKISEQDIVSHYLATSEGKKSQVFEFTLSHILLPKGAKDKAQDVLTALKKGESFDALAAQHSVDSESKLKSGAFGKFKSGEMIKQIEDSIRNLKIGQTSNAVETPMGLHIFRVSDKKLVNDPKMEKEKQNIYQKLFAQEFKEQLEYWLLQKRKDAIIQVNKL